MQLRRLIVIVRNRVEGLLEEGGIQLTSVVTDTFGVSGWAILPQLVPGESTPEVLAGEARGALRKKQVQLREALAGRPIASCCNRTWTKWNYSAGRCENWTNHWR